MAVATAPKKTEALKSDQIEQRPLLAKPDGYYRVTLQLGSRGSYRIAGRCFSGHLRSLRNNPDGKGVIADHVPVVHESVGPVTGHELNGLIQSQNEWVDRHKRRQPFGQVDHQIVVLDYQPTDEVPKDRMNTQFMLIKHLIDAAVDSKISALTGAK